MSNRFSNKLEIIGTDEQVKEVREFLKGEPNEYSSENYIDFNNIKKIPEELIINQSSTGKLVHFLLFGTKEYYGIVSESSQLKFQGLTENEKREGFELALKSQSNFEKYGYYNQFDWSAGTWGVKWNAYWQELPSENIITFVTSWSPVPELLLELSVTFSDITFDYSCSCFESEESYHFIFKNGEILQREDS